MNNTNEEYSYCIYEESYNKAKSEVLKMVFKEKLLHDLHTEGSDLPDFKDVPSTYKPYIDWYVNFKGTKGRYMWITVNPSPDVSPQYFITKTEKCFSKKWMLSYFYVYEWTDDDKIHLHALVDRGDKRPYNAQQEIYNTYSDCVGSKQHVHTKFIREDLLQSKVNYMLKTEDFSKRQKYNKFREELSLSEYYLSNAFSPILVENAKKAKKYKLKIIKKP